MIRESPGAVAKHGEDVVELWLSIGQASSVGGALGRLAPRTIVEVLCFRDGTFSVKHRRASILNARRSWIFG